MSLSLGLNHIFKNRGIEISFFFLSKYAVSKKGLCLLPASFQPASMPTSQHPCPFLVLALLPAPPPHATLVSTLLLSHSPIQAPSPRHPGCPEALKSQEEGLHLAFANGGLASLLAIRLLG